jgi:hypothetical protein
MIADDFFNGPYLFLEPARLGQGIRKGKGDTVFAYA